MNTLRDNGKLEGLLGIRHPIVQGPFGGGLSTVELAAAVSEGGGLGSFGAHHLGPDGIHAVVTALKRATGRPFAVNLWVPQPGETDRPDLAGHVERLRPYYDELGIPSPETDVTVPDFADQMSALLAAEPPVISFVMGIPPEAVLEQARRIGIRTIGTATTVDEAIALEAAGLDAIVASGSDAGGHRGAFLRPVRESLVGTFSLIPQVADAVSIPVIAAGGITDARGIRAALTLGADAVQIGTGFLATHESGAGQAHKDLLGGPHARVTVLTRLFSGRHARGIPNRLTHELAAAEDLVPPYPMQNTLMQPLRQTAAQRGLTDYMSLWAGQSAPLAHTQSAREYLDTLVSQLGKEL